MRLLNVGAEGNSKKDFRVIDDGHGNDVNHTACHSSDIYTLPPNLKKKHSMQNTRLVTVLAQAQHGLHVCFTQRALTWELLK